MRGKLSPLAHIASQPRITPAHAGKTLLTSPIPVISSDHPRACGENIPSAFPAASMAGSPPRMRGKQRVYYDETAQERITPAHAGKTLSCIAQHVIPPDHPRACGENKLCLKRLRPVSGSPPRMRGKQYPAFACSLRLRITPAHAGKTFTSLLAPAHFTDHPRACGENSLSRMDLLIKFGSPPRMRGKLKMNQKPYYVERITPAHAGKTRIWFRDYRLLTDHPRACGENEKRK